MADLEGIGEVDLDELDSDFDRVSEDEDDKDNLGLLELDDDGLEAELEAEYLRFAKRARDKKASQSKEDMEDDIREGVYDAALSTKKAKKSASSEAIAARREQQDQEDFQEKGHVEDDLQEYARLLSGATMKKKRESADEEEDDEDSGDDSEEDEEEEARPSKKRRGGADAATAPINTRDTLSLSAKASKWFANPIFKESVVTSSGDASLAAVAAGAEMGGAKKRKGKNVADGPVDSDDEDAALAHLKNLEMPLTDKQLRQQKRKKDMEKKARKDEKRQRALMSLDGADGMFSTGIEIAPADEDEDDVDLDQETLAMRSLIRKGMGKQGRNKDPDAAKPFEIAPAAATVHSDEEYDEGDSDDELKGGLSDGISKRSVDFTGERVDPRSYDSDDEVYDNKDRAMTLALGTMMLRKSRKKALVDASYNRFAWNDPKDLPSWFIDDEMRHNRPQLPVPNALLEQINSKFTKTGTKEIKKVAEARMRKRKRDMQKLKTAKQQAKTVAENSDMTDRQKIKAINRAMKTTKVDKPSKVYVVTRKSKAGSMATKTSDGKGKLKFVDKRMRSDIRGEKAREKKAKKRGKKKH